MPCKICNWLCDRFCPPELSSQSFWETTYRWEDEFARDWEPWEDDDILRTQVSEAVELLKTNASQALELLIALADKGSVPAMRWVGYLYDGYPGIGENQEMAGEYYHRALCAGSWSSTISYANFLYRRGEHKYWPNVLEDGMAQGFVPAFFWYSWNKYRLRPSNRVAHEVRPLMLIAVEAGHPGAELVLARWAARGRFGLRKIPEGFRLIPSIVAKASAAHKDKQTADTELKTNAP
ncbi:MAG: hypothetical protein AAF067_10250 [Pseudomonadota bacterium]